MIKLHTNEYVPYQKMYIDLVDNKSIMLGLEASLKEGVVFFNAIDSEKFNHTYQDGKWTIKELLLHVIDTERIFQYRALRFSRHDKTNLPGFSENDFVQYSRASTRSKDSLIAEFKAVRMSTMLLFETFDEQTLLVLGNSGDSTMSVRALGYLAIGHQRHHVNVVEQRYLIN